MPDSVHPLVSLELTELLPGSCCTVVDMGDETQPSRLKSMGICLGRTLEVVKSGDPLILKVYGTRIGLSSRLAKGIKVQVCNHSHRCWENNA